MPSKRPRRVGCFNAELAAIEQKADQLPAGVDRLQGGFGSSRVGSVQLLGKATRGAHADFDRIGFEVAIVGLPRIGGHGNGLVADVLDLVDRAGLGERLAGSVVTNEFDAHGTAPTARRGTDGQHDRVASPASVPGFVPPHTATLAFFARLALPLLTGKAIFSRGFLLRRRGRVAEGGGLLNRYTGHTVSGVRIPPSPPKPIRTRP